MRKLLLLALLPIAGCASHSGVVGVGGNSYLITKQAATGFPGLGNMKTEVIQEASAHCTTQKRQVQIGNISETQPPYILGNYPRVEVNFRCE
jgi:hypothetical protein